MKHWLLLSLLGIRSLTFAADSVEIGCNRLELVLDSKLTPEVLEHAWASGESLSEAPALLALHGCKGELFDKLTLDAPLARLDRTPLRGTRLPTYLVTVDLTAPAGSYSGPLTRPVQVVNHRLIWAGTIAADGRFEPIQLASTGKAAWRKLSTKTADDLLSVNCQPKDTEFMIFYRRYHPTRRGWQVRVRSEPGFWESDHEFPDIRHFR